MLADTYRLVRLAHYDEAQLSDPERVSAEFARGLLLADTAWIGAEQEYRRRHTPKS